VLASRHLLHATKTTLETKVICFWFLPTNRAKASQWKIFPFWKKNMASVVRTNVAAAILAVSMPFRRATYAKTYKSLGVSNVQLNVAYSNVLTSYLQLLLSEAIIQDNEHLKRIQAPYIRIFREIVDSLWRAVVTQRFLVNSILEQSLISKNSENMFTEISVLVNWPLRFVNSITPLIDIN